LLKEFSTAESLYEKLGLSSLPAVSENVANESSSSAMVKAALEQDLGREGINKATELLKPCFGGSKARALTALTKLYQCGYENVCLYKELVTLREDLDIERIVLHSGSHAESLNRYRSQPPVVADARAVTAGVGGTLVHECGNAAGSQHTL
jgi:hypothetical protein